MNIHLKAIAKKETKHLLRDKRMLFVLFFFPAFLLVVFGYAINFDVDKIKLAVYDKDQSELTKDYINTLTSSGYFLFTENLNNDELIKTTLDTKAAQAVIVFPNDFSENYYKTGENASVQVLVDGVDGNTAGIISKYIQTATMAFNQKLSADVFAMYGGKPYVPIEVKPLFWYNITLETTKFLIPGLIAMILVIVAVISISLSIVREKEKGTIEQLNVSSLTTIELLVGKSIPYVIISLVNAAGILLAGFILFGIVIKGSLLLLTLCTLLFILASVSMGVLISVIAETQQVAFTMATFATLLPSMILSGFIFPIEGMPAIIQIITNVTPAKFFIVILRAIILKGVGVEVIWDQILYLVIFTVLLLLVSVIIKKKKEKMA